MTQNSSLVTAKQHRRILFPSCLLGKEGMHTHILLILKFACFRLIKALQRFRVGKWFEIFLATVYSPDLLHISFSPQNSMTGIIANLTDEPHPKASDPCNFSISPVPTTLFKISTHLALPAIFFSIAHTTFQFIT